MAMKYLWHFIITVALAILGSHLAMSFALSFPLSSANSILSLAIGVGTGTVLYLPVLFILTLHTKHSSVWITLVDLLGFLLIMYFVYGFVATVASV